MEGRNKGTCLGGADSPRRFLTKERQLTSRTTSVMPLTFIRQRAEVSMLITLLFVPVRHRTRKPLAVSKGKQDVVHRGPYRRTHWTRCRRRWKFRVSNLTPVWEGGVSGGERERGGRRGGGDRRGPQTPPERS